MVDPLPSPQLSRLIRGRLLRWFDRNRRDLPWRRTRDPYAIWVSEVMLQQTTVAAVIPFFQRFMAALPTLTDLASAEEQEVLRLWAGLGYYRRARNLHQAAQQLVQRHGSQLPDDKEVWTGLPGVGRYTVGAVLSQAFDCRLPIIEANSRRVLCRLFGLTEDPTRGPLQKWLWSAAEVLLPSRRVGDFNQALMELGALVCKPANPSCDTCPLAEVCQARKLGLQDVIPKRLEEPKVVEVIEAAVVIKRGPQVLLVQRPEGGRWANFWEFPHGTLEEEETPKIAARRLALELTGLSVAVGGELLNIRHGVTRHRITMSCFTATSPRGRFRSSFYPHGEWVEPVRLGEYPISSPQRRLAAAVVERPAQGWLF